MYLPIISTCFWTLPPVSQIGLSLYAQVICKWLQLHHVVSSRAILVMLLSRLYLLDQYTCSGVDARAVRTSHCQERTSLC